MALRVLRQLHYPPVPKRKPGHQHLIDRRVPIGAAVMLLRGASYRLREAIDSEDQTRVLEEMRYAQMMLRVYKDSELWYQDGRKARHCNKFVLDTHKRLGKISVDEATQLLQEASIYLQSNLQIIWQNEPHEIVKRRRRK